MRKLILFTVMILLLTSLVIAGPNDPSRFGNLTTDTAWIGGSAGIGNFTGWVETHDEFKGNLNASYIQNPIWIETADEGNLNVNSSTFWASVSSFISKWFYDDGNVLSFNVTELNKTIDARSDFDTKWGVDGVWIYNNSGDLSFNTTSGDSRYYTQTAADLQFIAQADEADLNVNSSDYWDGLGSPSDIAISDLDQTGETDLNVNSTTFWAGVAGFVTNWFYDNANVLSFNETLLNNTIDARENDTTYTSDEIYINLVSTTFNLNESKLNSTIDDRSDFDTKWDVDGVWIYNNSGSLSFNTTSGDSRYYTQSSADSQFIAQSEEGNLDVNSSDYWDGLGSPSDIATPSKMVRRCSECFDL